MQLFANEQRIVVEGAGAVPLAAVLAHPDLFTGLHTVLIVTGGNIDARLLSNVLLRGLRRSGRIARLRIDIDDRPGVLARVTRAIGACGADIVDIHHQRLFSDLAARKAVLDVVLETRNPAKVDGLIDELRREGFGAVRS